MALILSPPVIVEEVEGLPIDKLQPMAEYIVRHVGFYIAEYKSFFVVGGVNISADPVDTRPVSPGSRPTLHKWAPSE